MTSKHLGAVAAGLLVIASACQKPPQFTAADEAEVRAMFDSTAAWIKARNFDRWADQFEPTARFQPANAKTATDRAGLLAWGNGAPPAEILSFSDVQVSGEGNMAYGSSSYVLKLKDLPVDTGKQLVVFRRGVDGKWKVAAGSYSSDLPIPTPPSSAPNAKK